MTNNIRNVFILSVDSLSYKYFSDQASSISDQLSGVNYRNAIAPSTNTRCSAPAFHAGIFSDSELLELPPIRIPKMGGVTTVAEQFRANGYATGFWTPNHIFGNANNYDRGFDHGNKGKTQSNKQIADLLKKYGTKRLFDIAQSLYFFAIKPTVGKLQNREGYVWAPAEKIQNDVLSWFDKNYSEPVFCWVHYMDTHHPFEPPADYLEEVQLHGEWDRGDLSFFTRDAIKNDAAGLSDEEIADVEQAYMAACEYLGDQMQEFIRILTEKGYFDPDLDLLCISADHGEAFAPKKHGVMGHATFFEEVVRVPFVFHHPDWLDDTIDEQVSLIDLMPTVLDAAGISVPETFEGEICRTPSDFVREFAYSIDGNPIRRCIRGNERKLFAHRIGEDSYEVVFTEYSDGHAIDEQIRFRKGLEEWTTTDPTNLTDDCSALLERIRETHGDVIESNPVYLESENEG